MERIILLVLPVAGKLRFEVKRICINRSIMRLMLVRLRRMRYYKIAIMPIRRYDYGHLLQKTMEAIDR